MPTRMLPALQALEEGVAESEDGPEAEAPAAAIRGGCDPPRRTMSGIANGRHDITRTLSNQSRG